MSKTTIKSKYVRNENLFELQKAQELQISAPLLEFLIKYEYPCLALGKAFTQFVESCVQSIAKEQRLVGRISSKAFLKNEESIVISKDAIVEAGASIAGPCFIEPGAVIPLRDAHISR